MNPHSDSYVFHWISAAILFTSVALLAIFCSGMVSTRGFPLFFAGCPFNYLYLVAALCVVLIATSLIAAREHRDVKHRFVKAAKLSLVASVCINSFLLLGIALNADHFSIVPSEGRNMGKCVVVYSYANTAMNHHMGRFYVVSKYFGIPNQTDYSWIGEGSGKVAQNDWKVRWDGTSGVLIVQSNIGIDPDGAIPAHFSCD